MKMSKSEYDERKARIDAGEGSDDDRRLVDLYAPHFERDAGEDGTEDVTVHTAPAQPGSDGDTQVVGISGSSSAEVVKGTPAKKVAAKKATQGQRQNGTN